MLLAVAGIFLFKNHVALASGSATVTRLAGTDRYTTAIEVSQELYPTANSAGSVVIANGENFPDALAAAPLAYKLNAPILLTSPTYISGTIMNEVDRVLPSGTRVYIVGGTSAVSDTVKNIIQSYGYPVTRVAGATDRISTAIAIANQTTSAPSGVFIVNSSSYADGVSASSPAAKNRYPILLNPSTSLSSAVKSYLDAHNVQNIYIVGGTSAISSGVASSLTSYYDDADTNITRIAGVVDRYGTSEAVASQFYATSPAKITFANGVRYPDALVGGLLAAKKSGPLLLTETNSVLGDASDYIVSHVPTLTKGYLVGGTGVLGTTNETVITHLLQDGDVSSNIAAAGDVSCDTADPNYNGGSGTSSYCRMQATANLVSALAPDYVLGLGDLQYEDGTLTTFNASYNNSWGAFKATTLPAPGNHEYHTANADGYFDYFNGVGVPGTSGLPPAGNRSQGWYSTDIGSWHIIALNSNCSSIGGCDGVSAQHTWLAADLSSNTATCTLTFWHHPRFSSGSHGSDSTFGTFWSDLSVDSAEVVLNGHDHMYERFEKQTPAQTTSDSGIREFVVGTGGKNLTGTASVETNSANRISSTFGVVFMRLYDWGYTWKFVNESQQILDSGSDICH